MTIISPSLLACDFLNLETELKSFEQIPDVWFHLDVMDGHFVPNLTFGHPLIAGLHRVTSHPLDAHLMVTNPEFYIETFKDYGLHNLTLHIEATQDALGLVKLAKKYYPSVGISIKPKTPAEAISDELLKELNLILVMSVEPGFGGQAFIEGTYGKIRRLKMKKDELDLKFVIQVDGGVNDKNAHTLTQAGADNLVAGSYIFKAPADQYSVQVESLRNVTREF